jgi:ferredoxin
MTIRRTGPTLRQIHEELTSMTELTLLKSARLAVRGCPRLALRIERTNGPA